ncbi:MAG TPA: HAMP domain-containing sensor histidine kinase [Solirubrobacteraceae bacterium]|nr:HAMP domain-containing sensor histidine kinase [Solirubrobacteraceae bacterium]
MSVLVQWAGWAVATPALVVVVAQGVLARRRRALVARTCHEVRGPLTALGLALTGMGRRGEAPAAGLAALETELTRAAAAIEDLLRAGRGRQALGRPEAVELCALLQAAVAAWAAGGHAVHLEPVPETWVLADRVRLARAVANLVANAVEHGGGAVVVRSHCGSGRVVIEVADEGQGLPAPVAALIGRGHAGRRGHGLAVAAETARRHGGRLVARPAARGARLALELPARSLTLQEPA